MSTIDRARHFYLKRCLFQNLSCNSKALFTDFGNEDNSKRIRNKSLGSFAKEKNPICKLPLTPKYKTAWIAWGKMCMMTDIKYILFDNECRVTQHARWACWLS